MKTISLCCPVWGRYELTALMMNEWLRIFSQARRLGVEATAVLIGNDAPLHDLADHLGFQWIDAPNRLGRKYNDGHEWAVREGFDVSFQVNSDQVFDPALLAAICAVSEDSMIATRWLTAVNQDGRRAITTYNPLWSMRAYPVKLLRNAPRPCDESLDRMCDTGVFDGVRIANPDADTVFVELHSMEVIQFESSTQLTPWSRHQKVALLNGTWDHPVPWAAIADQHGTEFVDKVRTFYGLGGSYERHV